MDPQLGFVELSSGAGLRSAGLDDGERPASFRFSTTWSSLLVALQPVKAAAALVPLESRAASSVIAPEETPAQNRPAALAPPVIEPSPAAEASGTELPPRAADVNWEMIVPKMVRPARGTASRPLFAAPPPAAPAPSAAPVPSNPPSTPQYVVREYQIPAAENFPPQPNLFPLPEASRFGVKLAGGAVSVVVLAWIAWFGVSSPAPQSVQVESAPGDAGWTRQATAAGAGARQERQLILYQPSLSSSDSQLEFTWSVAGKTVGWVFRARDSANYCAMRLKVLGYGRSRSLAAEHFTVAAGKESPHYEKLLSLSDADSALRVKMDVAGPLFTLYLHGRAAEEWTNPSFTTGGLGFFEERNQPVEVQAVRISFTRNPQSIIASSLQALTKTLQ